MNKIHNYIRTNFFVVDYDKGKSEILKSNNGPA